jgi:hypothetical protein
MTSIVPRIFIKPPIIRANGTITLTGDRTGC